MSNDSFATARAHLAEALHAEAKAGFPRLMQIPSTEVVQFLDFLDGLQVSHRENFFSQQAEWWAAILLGRNATRPEAWETLRNIVNAPGPLVGGPRYMDVRGFRSVATFFGSRERWLKQYSGRQLHIREDLIPDESVMIPAKATLLRKVLTEFMIEHGFSKHKRFGEIGFLSKDRVLVCCDFGGRTAQFRYDVLLDVEDPDIPLVGQLLYSYERLWGIGSAHWDLLTEENAVRCMGAVADLVEATARVFRNARGAA